MENICKDCKHYRQHYTMDQKTIFRVYCGHCVLRIKAKKRPDTAACNDFTYAPPDESAFASKEFLSKALLDYMMGLDLLPEIKNNPGDLP